MKVYGFNKVAQATEKRAKSKKFNLIVSLQIKFVLPFIIITIVSCCIVLYYNPIPNWNDGILYFALFFWEEYSH